VSRVVPAFEQPEAVGRHPGDGVGDRRREPRDDQVGDERRGSAEPVLLPAPDEVAGRPAVGGDRLRGRERQPPPRTVEAALDRPRGRAAAAAAARAREERQRPATGVAKQLRSSPAGDAASREDQVGEPRRRRYGGSCDVSVTAS
jgi:hypothetical protein